MKEQIKINAEKKTHSSASQYVFYASYLLMMLKIKFNYLMMLN